MTEIPAPSELAEMRWWPYLRRAYEIPVVTSDEGALERLKEQIISGSGVSTPFNDAGVAAE